MNAKQVLGPCFLAFTGAYLLAGWFAVLADLHGLQTTVLFGEFYVLLTILFWRMKEDDLQEAE